jgi:hypothetical protein
MGGNTAANSIALTKGFELVDHPPHVGLGRDNQGGIKPSNRLAAPVTLVPRHSLKQLRKVRVGLKSEMIPPIPQTAPEPA